MHCTEYKYAACCYQYSVVCMSACVCVSACLLYTTVSPKMAELIEVLFRIWTCVPTQGRNHVLCGGLDPRGKRAFFWVPPSVQPFMCQNSLIICYYSY